MREFNKVFVVALPRCATVTMSDALGILGIRTAHLGRIYGEETLEHNNPQRLARIYEQMQSDDFHFDLLNQCDGLADYPACCLSVVKRLDEAFPGSLFINVTRDDDTQRWLQSVEQQFVGLQLLKEGRQATDVDRDFMRVMLEMRKLTFGAAEFVAGDYLAVYRRYQAELSSYFARRDDFLSIELSQLAERGFAALEQFLDCSGSAKGATFPNSNVHSARPREAFMTALAAGRVASQTGIVAASAVN